MNTSIGLYGIISDPLLGWAAMAEAMVACGVGWIQLRMKEGTPVERYRVACAVRERVPASAMFIVNDDPSLAVRVGADGVHLGQRDGSVARARAIMGPAAIIGLSTHSVEQVRAACGQGPDYLGMGPVFPTATKADAEPCIGLEGLRAMAAVSTLPAVAIGGIGLDQAAAVMAAGVQGLCAVGPVNASAEPSATIRAFRAAVGICGPYQSRAP
jgi:thiamine-phosphate pyrophosphorylase